MDTIELIILPLNSFFINLDANNINSNNIIASGIIFSENGISSNGNINTTNNLGKCS